MVVLDWQEISLARLQPASGRTALALWAMPITTGVVGDLGMLAGLAAQHMAAQLGTAAALDGRHHLELAQAQMSALSAAPTLPLGAQDIRDL